MPLKGFRCQLSGEPLSFAECIRCAEQSQGDSVCDFVPAVLKGIYSQIREPLDEDEWSITQTLGCPRKARLSKELNFYVTPENMYWAFRGQLTHGLIDDALLPDIHLSPPRTHFLEERLEAEIDGMVLSGTPDEFQSFDDGKTWLLRDYKTCRAVPRYKHAYTNHQQQLNGYNWLLHESGYHVTEAEVVYLDMMQTKRLTVKLKPLEQTERELRARLALLKQAELPPRKLTADNRWECDFCPKEIVNECYRLQP